MTDQNGTVHQYSYDLLGRPTADSVITLGMGIDGTVRRIARTYNTLGLPQNVTSYSASGGGSVVNDIQYQYNGFRQVIAEYQAHGGPVSVMTTPSVQYTYADGSQNTARLAGIVYPSGTGPSYEYGDAGCDGDMLSRVISIMDGSGPIVDYTYIGPGAFVQVDYPEPGIRYDLAFGLGTNLYAGLDNFGRVIDCRWRTVSAGSDVERIQYGYDQASNRTWRHNTVAPGGNDELYTYDGQHRLVDFQRGTFSGSDRSTITSQTLQQQWTLDATGNWSAFVDTDALVPSNSVNQTRTHTLSNEIATFGASSGSVWATPHYDAAGNMIAFPQPVNPNASYSATYDAWNRMVSIVGIAAYTYDGVNRRSTKALSGGVRHYYYSSNWQVLEETVDTSTSPDRQFIWGPRYIDDLVLRERAGQRLYALQDSNWNVAAVVDGSGVVQERRRYTAYGAPVLLDASFEVPFDSGSAVDWEVTYGGYRCDDESALYAARVRYLHGLVGVWTNRDPVEYSAGDINLCRYVRGTPATSTDPLGLAALWSPGTRTTGGTSQPVLVVRKCTVVIYHDHGRSIGKSPRFASDPADPACQAGRYGYVACFGALYNDPTDPGLITGFPDIRGFIGSGTLQNFQDMYRDFTPPAGFSKDPGDVNLGYGLGVGDYKTAQKDALDAGADQAKAQLKCCASAMVVFCCSKEAEVQNTKLFLHESFCGRAITYTPAPGAPNDPIPTQSQVSCPTIAPTP